jgi:hypothetical protein
MKSDRILKEQSPCKHKLRPNQSLHLIFGPFENVPFSFPQQAGICARPMTEHLTLNRKSLGSNPFGLR